MSLQTYTSGQLTEALIRRFPQGWAIQGPAIMNGTYCAVSRNWVEGPFAKYYFDYLCARDQRTWQKRGNQCEHFAIRAALEAVELFRQSADREIPAEAESLAVAWCKYLRSDGLGWHEVNLWFLEGAWVEWEPQRQAFFHFTAAEESTVQQIAIP